MKKVLLIVAIILIVSTGRVYALNYNSIPRSIYTYEKESNTNTNQINNLTTITSGAQTWYKVPKNRYRLRIQYNFISDITEGYYDVIFNTFNEDRVVFNGYLLVGATEYSCESYYDQYVAYPAYPEQGGDQQNLSSGSQTWICRNVAIANNVYMNVWLNGNVGASTNHYVYFSQNINFVPVDGITNAINNQTDSIINANSGATIPTAPSSAEAESIEATETELIEDNQFDSSVMSINIDTNTNSFIWSKITSIVQANAKVFSMIITCLSLGIIKLVFNR